MGLPHPVHAADEALHRVVRRYRLAEHLNPVNLPEARAAWGGGADPPPFRYAPAHWADDALRELDGIGAPEDHPLGVELRDAAREFSLMVRAVRDRTAAAFDALARGADWYPAPVQPPDRVRPADTSEGPVSIPAAQMVEVLRAALEARGFRGWSVRFDPVLASRVLVDPPRQEVRVNPRARFREQDRAALVAHEIDVHVTRAVCGARQSLLLFRTGLGGALATEEGLAIHAERQVGVSHDHVLDRQALVAAAVLRARDEGFASLYAWLADVLGPEGAWAVSVRVKRGLARPEEPGCYAKDAVYHNGLHAVADWLHGGGRLSDLYVGKVGLHHPVEEWVREGWVRESEAPAIWRDGFSPPG